MLPSIPPTSIRRPEADWLADLYAGYRAAHPELPDWQTFEARGHARLAELIQAQAGETIAF